MNTPAVQDDLNVQRWWLSNQGVPIGPHSEEFVLASLASGAISPQMYACPIGGQAWKRLCEWPAFAEAGVGNAAPSMAPRPVSTTDGDDLAKLKAVARYVLRNVWVFACSGGVVAVWLAAKLWYVVSDDGGKRFWEMMPVLVVAAMLFLAGVAIPLFARQFVRRHGRSQKCLPLSSCDETRDTSEKPPAKESNRSEWQDNPFVASGAGCVVLVLGGIVTLLGFAACGDVLNQGMGAEILGPAILLLVGIVMVVSGALVVFWASRKLIRAETSARSSAAGKRCG